VELVALQRTVRLCIYGLIKYPLTPRSFEYWQDGAPKDRPTIVSRLVTAEYWRQQCPLWFPGSFGLENGKRAADVNKFTGGWDVTNTTRLMYTNGQLDPWRDATVSSISRPGGPLQSTARLPVSLVTGGTHCSDLYGQNWAANAELATLVTKEVATMKAWVDDYYTKKNKTTRRWVA
jgi:Serine carboxypeptidase S28